MYLLVLAGDGIGPEITAATLCVLRAASERFDLQLRIEEAATGHAGLRTHGHTIHPDIVEKARRADGVVLGPTSTFEFKDPARGEVNPSMMLRKSLDLFANIRPARTYAGFPLRCGEFDLVVARENTEGFYADRNMEAGSGEMLGCRYFVAPDYTRLQRAHCAHGFRAGDDQAQARHDRAQGKCAESDRWAIHRGMPERCAGVSIRRGR
jgi:3-isopropylmalate dehydrogenase